MAAAELTGRACLGIELDPKFVDVIVMRWEMLSGTQATLEGSDGRTFEQVKIGGRKEPDAGINVSAIETPPGEASD